MGLKQMFGTDRNREIEGITVDYGDFRVILARAGGQNKPYLRLLERLAKPYQRQIDTGILDDEVGDQLVRQAFAQAVVKGFFVKRGDDWVEGINGEDLGAESGDTLPASVDNLVLLFQTYPDFFRDLQEVAQKHVNFLQSQNEDDGKN